MARAVPLPDQAYLLECLDYDPETGEFRWRQRPRHHFPSDRACKSWNAQYSGTAAGYVPCKVRAGGVLIRVGGKRYFAHRIAFKIMTGADPTDDIDHINRQPTDNRWINLRAATNQQNMYNSGLSSNNSTGFKGVYFHKRGKKFVAKIMVNKKSIYLGFYTTKEDAFAAYCAAAKEHFGEFWCPG